MVAVTEVWMDASAGRVAVRVRGVGDRDVVAGAESRHSRTQSGGLAGPGVVSHEDEAALGQAFPDPPNVTADVLEGFVGYDERPRLPLEPEGGVAS
jgi:hypothetical protein